MPARRAATAAAKPPPAPISTMVHEPSISAPAPWRPTPQAFRQASMRVQRRKNSRSRSGSGAAARASRSLGKEPLGDGLVLRNRPEAFDIHADIHADCYGDESRSVRTRQVEADLRGLRQIRFPRRCDGEIETRPANPPQDATEGAVRLEVPLARLGREDRLAQANLPVVG